MAWLLQGGSPQQQQLRPLTCCLGSPNWPVCQAPGALMAFMFHCWSYRMSLGVALGVSTYTLTSGSHIEISAKQAQRGVVLIQVRFHGSSMIPDVLLHLGCYF